MSLRTLSDEEIRDRFRYHKPSPKGADRHANLSVDFSAVAFTINENCPHGRAKDSAFQKLEEAKFWASAAIARNEATR